MHATAAKINDPVIHRLIDKICVGPPPTQDVGRYRQGAAVTIRTTDGRTSTSTVIVPKGAGITGIAWIDIDAKYRTLVPRAGLPDHQVEASLAVIHDFRGVTNVSALTDLLNPPDGWSRRRRVSVHFSTEDRDRRGGWQPRLSGRMPAGRQRSSRPPAEAATACGAGTGARGRQSDK